MESEELFNTLEEVLVSNPELVRLNLLVSLDDCLAWLEVRDWLDALFIDGLD